MHIFINGKKTDTKVLDKQRDSIIANTHTLRDPYAWQHAAKWFFEDRLRLFPGVLLETRRLKNEEPLSFSVYPWLGYFNTNISRMRKGDSPWLHDTVMPISATVVGIALFDETFRKRSPTAKPNEKIVLEEKSIDIMSWSVTKGAAFDASWLNDPEVIKEKNPWSSLTMDDNSNFVVHDVIRRAQVNVVGKRDVAVLIPRRGVFNVSSFFLIRSMRITQ